MQNIGPFLWLDNQAEEAATFYTSVFKNSRILNVTRYPEGSPAPAGLMMQAMLALQKIEIAALRAAHDGTDLDTA